MPEAEEEIVNRKAYNDNLGTIKKPLPARGPQSTLTVAMIVRNESVNIREAIESFRPIADQIVVNDTGSTDGTQEILKSLGVDWFQSEWKDDFSLARNQSLERATCSWIIWLDADDRIPPEQVTNFLKLKTATLDRIFGFQVINIQNGMAIGSRFFQLRMFPNHERLRFCNRVHEQIVFSAAELGLHCIYTETTIHHTGYQDPEVIKSKARRNLALLEKEAVKLASDPALAMSKGDAYFILEQWEQGIEAFRSALEIPRCREKNSDVWNELPARIGKGYQHLNRLTEALHWLMLACERQPRNLECAYYCGECLMQLGRVEEAEKVFVRVIGMPVVHTATAIHFDITRIFAMHRLGGIYLSRSEFSDAERVLTEMTRHYPQVVEGWHLLGKCHLAMGRKSQAKEAWLEASNHGGGAQESLHRDLLGLLAELGPEDLYRRHLTVAQRHYPGTNFPQWQGLVAPREQQESNSKRPLISLCMIVKNECGRLEHCLESARGLADDIVIVDTGSQDGTQEIAQSFGARVIQSDWRNDFSWARNQSLDAARGHWILWLDADDILLPADRDAMRDLARKSLDSIGAERAFGFVVKNSQDGGVTGQVFNQIRMFPNRPDLRFTAPVHEQILPAIEAAGIPVEYHNIRILHTGYCDDATVREKQLRNRKILERQIERGETVTPISCFTLANACYDLKDFAAAERWYRDALRLAKHLGNNPHVVELAPTKVAACLASAGRLAEALQELDTAMDSGSRDHHPETILVRAQLEAALGRFEQARGWYEMLFTLQEKGLFMPADFQLLKIKALEYLALYFKKADNLAMAVDLLRAGLAIKSGRDFSEKDLLSLYARFSVQAAAL